MANWLLFCAVEVLIGVVVFWFPLKTLGKFLIFDFQFWIQ